MVIASGWAHKLAPINLASCSATAESYVLADFRRFSLISNFDIFKIFKICPVFSNMF